MEENENMIAIVIIYLFAIVGYLALAKWASKRPMFSSFRRKTLLHVVNIIDILIISVVAIFFILKSLK